MTDSHPTASPFLPPRFLLPTLVRAAAICTGCELHHAGTRTVFGEGPAPAELMLVGEQPGDREDEEGKPFVGPAGALLDRCLERAGIPRRAVYVTNVVKHFRWEGTRGKQRLHRKPSMRHIAACRPWLDAELAVVRPRVVLCLGATAAKALLGSAFEVTRHRGQVHRVDDLKPLVATTVHPASILRARGDQERRAELEAFVGDLEAVRRALER